MSIAPLFLKDILLIIGFKDNFLLSSVFHYFLMKSQLIFLPFPSSNFFEFFLTLLCLVAYLAVVH